MLRTISRNILKSQYRNTNFSTLNKKEVPIFLLHGLRSNTMFMFSLEKYLQHFDYNVHNIRYYPNINTLDGAISDVSDQMHQITKKNEYTNDPIIVGHSLGGNIALNLHRLGWNPLGAIAIGSPLFGAKMLCRLDAFLFWPFHNIMFTDGLKCRKLFLKYLFD